MAGGNWEGANLRGTNLRGAKLNCALSGASLPEANLTDAVVFTDLRQTNLDGAILVNTSIIGSNFTEVDLTHLDLEQVKALCYTTFTAGQLSLDRLIQTLICKGATIEDLKLSAGIDIYSVYGNQFRKRRVLCLHIRKSIPHRKQSIEL